MPSWKSNLIEAYRIASWPYRRLQYLERSRNGKLPIYSLFYHRVADTEMNPWTISCDDFQRQIDWFEENFEIVDLRECQRRINSGFNNRPTLSITFDDGYAENCEYALPMLIERRIPLTYFVTTYHTTEQKHFPHDLDRGTPLPVNTIESLRALDMAGIEIGAHTRTHRDLSQVTSHDELVDEVVTASREMEKLIGRKIEYFAFPYGQYRNLNPRVFEMLRQSGFLGVCSAYGGWNDIGGDAFHIQRIHGDPDFNRVKNWLTYDPRIGKVERYDYEQIAQSDQSQNAPELSLPIKKRTDLVSGSSSSFSEEYVSSSNLTTTQER